MLTNSAYSTAFSYSISKIGAKIRKHRLEKGMTQSELAFEIGVKDWSQISRMER